MRSFRSVKSAIRADQFFDAMIDMTAWNFKEGITPSFSNYRREKNGDCLFNVTFTEDGQAENFMGHFGGSLTADGQPFARLIGSVRPDAWAERV